MAWEFQQLLADFRINDAPITSPNPVPNGIRGRMHQTVSNVIRALVHENTPHTLKHEQDL